MVEVKFFLSIFLLIIVPFVIGSSNKTTFKELIQSFEAKDQWEETILNHCDTKTDKLFFNQSTDPKYTCQIVRIYIYFLKAEILSFDPPLIKFHRFLPKRLIKEFLDLSKILNHRDLVIEADEDGKRHAKTSVRIVKGLFLPHYFHPTTHYTFDYIRTRFPAINFFAAEEYQILNYVPGGHYAPHYDYFDFEDNYRLLGNRMITFMVILKTSKIGGGTIYPKIGVTFQPKPGDAVIWFNQNPDDTKAENSLHGACPVLKGTKIGMTLWIRSKGQMFCYPCPLEKNKTFPMDLILKPKIENISIRKYVFV